jgi:hypothetical protein
VLASLRESEQHPDSGRFGITPLTAPGWPRYPLAIEKQGNPPIERVVIAQRLWRLTARQARVLELVAGGATNKEIASARLRRGHDRRPRHRAVSSSGRELGRALGWWVRGNAVATPQSVDHDRWLAP